MNEALRNGNWETNCGGKDGAGKFCFYFLKKKVKKTKSHQS